jgi:plasmid stabilization system protein ParE
MDYEIAWSDEAKANYRTIALYLLDAFGFGVDGRYSRTT